MSIVRKIALVVALFMLLTLGAAFWALGTESGTRFVLGIAEEYFPAALSVGETRGSLLGGVRFQTIRWESESTQVEVRETLIAVELLPILSRHVVISNLDVASVKIVIAESEASADRGELPSIKIPIDISIESSSFRNLHIQRDEFARTIDALELTGSLRRSDLDISRFALRSDWLSLDLDGRVTITDPYPAAIRADWQWATADAANFSGSVELRGDLRNYEVQHQLIAPVAVSTSGEISYRDRELFADLVNSWDALVWDTGEQTIELSAGTLQLTGTAARFDVGLDTTVRSEAVPETTISLIGTSDRESLQFSQLLAANAHGRLAASGVGRWLPQQEFGIDYQLSELDPSLLSDLLHGRIEVSGRATGSFRDTGPHVNLGVDSLAGVLNGNRVTGRGQFALADNSVTISNGRAQIGSNKIDVAGTIGDKLSVNAALDLPAIAEILPGASGSLAGQFAIGGTTTRPDVRANLNGANLSWSEFSIDSIVIDGDVSLDGRVSANVELRQLSFGENSLDSVAVSAQGSTDRHVVRVAVIGYDNELALHAAGSYAPAQWNGQIESLTVDNKIMGTWSTRGVSELTASREEVTLSKTCLFGPESSGSACAAGGLHEDGNATFDMSLVDLPLAALPVTVPEGVEARGFVNANLRGISANRRLDGEFAVGLRDAVLDARIDDELLTVTFTEASGEATIVDNRVASSFRVDADDGTARADLDLTVSDLASPESLIAGSGSIAITDASIFAVLLPSITNPRGRIGGDLEISGSLQRPEFTGEVLLSDGAAGIRQAGIEISDVNVRLAQREAGRMRLDGSARSGNGQVAISGETWLGAQTGIRSVVSIEGEDFELMRLPDWQVAASPRIEVVLDDRAAIVSGDLTIPNAAIRLKEIPEASQSSSPDAVVHRSAGPEPSVGRRIDLDVTTTLGDDVRFAGFGLTTALQGAVRIRGGTNKPYVGNGRLSLREGRYKAYGQELEVERGELIFNGPLDNPQLDIRAVRRTTDVLAGIQISGTPSQLNSDVFSEPVLSDAEALSYLLTGRPLSSATSAGEGDTLNNAAFALGLSGAGTIASQVRTELGLDTLALEGGADDSRLIAGKRFGSRLFVEYGYGLIDKLGTLLLRYELTERFMLESRTGTVSNLDLIYRVRKK